MQAPAVPERLAALLNELAIGHDWLRTERADGVTVLEKTMPATGRNVAVLLLPPGYDKRERRRLS